MKDEIQRLGFDAWADNKFVNLTEDITSESGTGNISIEHDDWHIKAEWDEQTIHCYIRAYTGHGWETYEKETKR